MRILNLLLLAVGALSMPLWGKSEDQVRLEERAKLIEYIRTGRQGFYVKLQDLIVSHQNAVRLYRGQSNYIEMAKVDRRLWISRNALEYSTSREIASFQYRFDLLTPNRSAAQREATYELRCDNYYKVTVKKAKDNEYVNNWYMDRLQNHHSPELGSLLDGYTLPYPRVFE